MLCPRCRAINKDNAIQCRECGGRLVGLRESPEAKKIESKYLLSGIIAFIGILIIASLLITSISCIACRSGCISCDGDENYINENVEGDWDGVGVSGSDLVTPTDLPPVDDSTAAPPAA